MDIHAICEEPIPGADPAGIDARYEPEYAAVMAEIEKLNSISAVNPNWSVVITESEVLLTKLSKDLSIACYLSYALFKTKGLEGFFESLTFLLPLFQNFWENAFPSIKKMRRRVNIFDWWHEKTYTDLELLLPSMKPVEEDFINAIKSAIFDLDSFIGENMPDAASLRDLLNLISRILVIPKVVEAAPEEPKTSEKEPEESIHETSSDSSENKKTNTTQEPEDINNAQADVSSPSSLSNTQATSPSLSPSTVVPVVTTTMGNAVMMAVPIELPVFPKLQPATEEEVKAKKTYLEAAKNYASLAIASNPQNPFPRQILRLAIWGNVSSLPASENGQTSLQPPDSMRVDALKKSYSSGNFMSVQQTGEDIFSTSIFFFDVQKMIADALKQLGNDFSYSYKVVCEETYRFIQRLPGIEKLCFDGGLPFASEETLDWIQSISTITVPVPTGNASTDSLSPIDEIISQAEAVYKEENIKSALILLDNFKQCGYKDNVAIRTAELNLLCKAGEKDLAYQLADMVLEEAIRNNLFQWDKDRSVDCLLTLRKAYTLSGKFEKALEVQSKILSLKPSEALNWSIPTVNE